MDAWTIAIGAIVLVLASPPASASNSPDSLSEVVGSYEDLAAQIDSGNGVGWPDVSKAAADLRLAKYKALRRQLDRLPVQSLSEQDALTRRLLAWRLDILIEGARFDEERIPFDNGDGFFNTANYAAMTTVLHDRQDAEAWIERLRALPKYYDQQIVNMRRGIATGFTQPRPTAESVLQILMVAADQPDEDSPLLKPFSTLPDVIPEADREALRAAGVAALREAVKPAQRMMVAFFRDEYLPNARPNLAASSLPDGRAYYEFAVRRSTTTDMMPDEVFAVGQAEIKRLRGEMEQQMRVSGFQGTFPQFLTFLRTDPQFYAPDLATYLDKASGIGKRVDYLLPRWFGKLPRLPWGIRQKPPEMEASSGGYNLGDPEKGISGAVVVGSRSFHDPLYSLPAWMMHEGVPGHHLQIALGQERDDLPKFRRRDDVTAFVEGWALYSERLGEDMGIYRTPYERFGRLSFEMWRACRLVMDVGIHWKGWNAQQARQCLENNTALSQSVAEAETQRYIAWPAQALAYKIGELQISGERRKAEAALGQRFDIRAFHDLVIDDGPMPLSILSERVDQWIARQSEATH